MRPAGAPSYTPSVADYSEQNPREIQKVVSQPGYLAPEGATSIPQLTHDQAMYISLLMEDGNANTAIQSFTALFERPPEIDSWSTDPAFIEALTLADTNRPLLLRAMSHALSGKVFRALSKMLDSDRSRGKAVELYLRLHGMLIDRVRDERPDELRDLLSMIRERVAPTPDDFHPTRRH